MQAEIGGPLKFFSRFGSDFGGPLRRWESAPAGPALCHSILSDDQCVTFRVSRPGSRPLPLLAASSSPQPRFLQSMNEKISTTIRNDWRPCQGFSQANVSWPSSQCSTAYRYCMSSK